MVDNMLKNKNNLHKFNMDLLLISITWMFALVSQTTVVRFLRESGSLIHVSDHTYRLTNLYFLDPNWLCDVLQKPLQHESNEVDIQSVPKWKLEKCCRDSGFGEDRFKEYLELLGRFEIAIPASSDRFVQLFVQMLKNKTICTTRFWQIVIKIISICVFIVFVN